MVPHSSILAWEIPRTEEPGGLQSIGSQRQTPVTEHSQAQTCPGARGGVCVCWEWGGMGRLIVGRLILGNEQKFHPIHTSFGWPFRMQKIGQRQNRGPAF